MTIALRAASSNDEPNPVDVQYVRGPASDVFKIINRSPADSDGVPADLQVDFISIAGSFIGKQAKVLPGAKLPTGDHMFVILNDDTSDLLAWGISNTDYNLAQAGKVQVLRG